MEALYVALGIVGILALLVLIWVLLKVRAFLESTEETLGHLQEVVEEVKVLPGAAKELADSMGEIARDLSEEVKGRLEKLDLLTETLEKRLSKEIPALLSEGEKALRGANQLIENVDRRLGVLEELFAAVQDLSRSVKEVSSTAALAVETLNREMRDLVVEFSAATAGVKEGIRVLSRVFRWRSKG